MSKTNKTTKVATLISWAADFGGGDIVTGYNNPHDIYRDVAEILIETSCGLVAWTNTCSQPSPGDRVILRKGAPRSHGAMPWVMTGWA